MKAYHYTNKPFDNFDITKCDGFWFTSISPDSEYLNDIGCADCNYVAVCEIEFDYSLLNGGAYDIEQLLTESGCDAVENRYDNGEIEYTDYALIDSSKIKIIEWIEL